MAVPLVVGAFFTGLADVAEPIGRHWRSMSWTALWLTVGTFVGGVGSRLGYEELFVVMVVAFICGLAGVVGQRGALNGMLALVMYAIFAGTPETPLANWQNSGLVALGGLIQVLAFVIPVLIFAPTSLRSAISAPSSFSSRIRLGFDAHNQFFHHAILKNLIQTNQLLLIMAEFLFQSLHLGKLELRNAHHFSQYVVPISIDHLFHDLLQMIQ